eukprot:Em0014g342a
MVNCWCKADILPEEWNHWPRPDRATVVVAEAAEEAQMTAVASAIEHLPVEARLSAAEWVMAPGECITTFKNNNAALATEGRKHRANDAKCGELGWLCVPLVAETYGAWGNEAIEVFSQLASGVLLLHAGPIRLHFQKSMAGSTSI